MPNSSLTAGKGVFTISGGNAALLPNIKFTTARGIFILSGHSVSLYVGRPTVSCSDPVFDRVMVDYLTLGGARITWDISSHFHGMTPWIFQLQVSQADITSGNWINIGSPLVDTYCTNDPVQSYYGKEENAFFRVLLTTADGYTYTSSPVSTQGLLDFRTWHFANEIVRKEQLRLRSLGVGINGFLFKARRSGTPCPVCLDTFTNEVTDSNCPTCFGTRWLGGYYAPIPAVFGDIPPSERYVHREEEAGEGVVNTRITKGILLAIPFLSMNDLWVNSTSDERHLVHSIQVLTHMRGVPLIQSVELRRVPTDWIGYSLQLPSKACP